MIFLILLRHHHPRRVAGMAFLRVPAGQEALHPSGTGPHEAVDAPAAGRFRLPGAAVIWDCGHLKAQLHLFSIKIVGLFFPRQVIFGDAKIQAVVESPAMIFNEVKSLRLDSVIPVEPFQHQASFMTFSNAIPVQQNVDYPVTAGENVS